VPGIRADSSAFRDGGPNRRGLGQEIVGRDLIFHVPAPHFLSQRPPPTPQRSASGPNRPHAGQTAPNPEPRTPDGPRTSDQMSQAPRRCPRSCSSRNHDRSTGSTTSGYTSPRDPHSCVLPGRRGVGQGAKLPRGRRRRPCRTPHRLARSRSGARGTTIRLPNKPTRTLTQPEAPRSHDPSPTNRSRGTRSR
jgi:hypothetical protein